MQPSPCDGFYPLAHVCQADEPALLLGRQAVGGNVIGAAAVILHGDKPVVGLLAGGNGHGAAAKAKDSLGLFADYMRVSTDAFNYNGLVSFPRELAHARNYAALEQLRFGNKLQVVYDIESEDFLLPALTLQPLVENAITLVNFVFVWFW